MDHSDDKKKETGLETLNVRLPDEIIKILDQLVARGLFANRSEAIREFVREYVLEERKATRDSAQGARSSKDGGAK